MINECLTCGNNPLCKNKSPMKEYVLEDAEISNCCLCQYVFYLLHEVTFLELNVPGGGSSVPLKSPERLVHRF